MNVTHLLLRQAAERPNTLAILERAPRRGGRSETFASLQVASAHAAARFQADGVRAGDAVLVFVPMSADLYVILIALFRLGAVAMFLDPSAGREHIARCCEILPPKAMIAVPKAHLLRLTTPALRRIPLHYSVNWWLPLTKWWSRSKSFPADMSVVTRVDDDAALITFTSGSTGRPKAAARSHGFLRAQHAALEKAIQLSPGQMDLATLPVFTLANLASGVTSIIPDAALRQVGRIDPLPVLEQVETWGVTRCVASPAFFERLLSADAGSLRQMKRIDTGGAPVFPSLLRRLQAAAPQAEVVALYGSTEAEPIAHVAWHEISADDVAAMLAGRGLLAGPVVEDVQLRIILDQWGTPIAPLTPSELDASTCGANEPGEIVVTGDHVLRGYLNGEGDSETKFRVDNTIWHRTGDAGYLDGRGRLWLLGRASAKIEDDRGTLYPFAIEAAASEIDGIRRSALVQHNGRRVLVIEPTGTASSDLPQRVMSSLGWAFLDVCRLLPHIPVDKRHNAKIDYTQLRRFL